MKDIDTTTHEVPIPDPRELPNLGRNERYGSIASGVALILLGLVRRRLSGLLLGATGAALLARGATGKCALYRSLGISSARSERPGVPDNLGTKVERSITIRRSPEEIYQFWRDLQNLPRFMKNLQKVEPLGGRRSHWVAIGPGGRTIEWDAEIINEHPNEMIAWESLPGAELENAGSVRFHPALEGRGTEVRISMQFNPTRGLLGMLAMKLLGESPETQVEDDLLRLKQLLETGKIASTGN